MCNSISHLKKLETKESKPLQIYKVIDGEYTLDLPAIKNIFNKVGNRKIAIYSMNGSLRSGKSFILNISLKYLARNGSGDWINNKLDYEFKFRSSVARSLQVITWNFQTKGGTLWFFFKKIFLLYKYNYSFWAFLSLIFKVVLYLMPIPRKTC